MAQFKNNNFSRDTHDEHSLRVSMCITGMDTYSGEVEFRANLPVKMQEHLENWDDIRSGLADEWGEQKGATILVNLLKEELHELIIDGRFMLYSMLDEEEMGDVEEGDIRKAYGLLEKIPQDIEGKIELARRMNEQNQTYIDAVSPFALPAADFEELAAKGIETRTAVDGQAKEILDVYHMNKMLEMERKRGNRLLSRGFKWIVAAWDDNDERLFAFGMLPKSAIWTPGDPDEPGVVNWDDVPTGVGIKLIKLGDNEFFVFSADPYTGNTGMDVRVAWGETGGAVAEMPGEDTLTNVPFAIQYDCEIKHGMTVYVWVRARKDEEVSDWSEVASLDVAM